MAFTQPPSISLADNATTRLEIDNEDNEPQPDVLLRIKEEYGGQSRISENNYVERAQELIMEITGSISSCDLYNKLRVYRRHELKEYLEKVSLC